MIRKSIRKTVQVSTVAAGFTAAALFADDGLDGLFMEMETLSNDAATLSNGYEPAESSDSINDTLTLDGPECDCQDPMCADPMPTAEQLFMNVENHIDAMDMDIDHNESEYNTFSPAVADILNPYADDLITAADQLVILGKMTQQERNTFVTSITDGKSNFNSYKTSMDGLFAQNIANAKTYLQLATTKLAAARAKVAQCPPDVAGAQTDLTAAVAAHNSALTFLDLAIANGNSYKNISAQFRSAFDSSRNYLIQKRQ